MKTILFQTELLKGLGHLSRLTAIADECGRLTTEVRSVFAVHGESAPLPRHYGFTSIALPSWPDNILSVTEPEAQRLNEALARTLLASLKVDLVVFDLLPDVGIVRACLAGKIPYAFVCRKAKLAYLERIRVVLEHASLIIVPDLRLRWLPKELLPKARLVGTIVRRPPVRKTPLEAPDPGRPRLLITGGAGGDANVLPFYQGALDAVAAMGTGELAVTFVAGPLFKQWERLRIPAGIRVIPQTPWLFELMESADLVVCQAGYNTIAEIRWLRARSVVVPAERTIDDQFERARQLSEQSAHVHLCEDPSALRQAIEDAMRQPRPDGARHVFSGGRRAARELLKLLQVPAV